MRSKAFIIGTMLIIPAIALCQPPKKKTNPPVIPQKPVDSMIVSDTLKYVTDTTQVQYCMWVGENYESYLAKINGYVVRVAKVGKYTTGQTVAYFFDFNWKALKPEDIEQNLTKPVKWKK